MTYTSIMAKVVTIFGKFFAMLALASKTIKEYAGLSSIYLEMKSLYLQIACFAILHAAE